MEVGDEHRCSVPVGGWLVVDSGSGVGVGFASQHALYLAAGVVADVITSVGAPGR